MRENFPPVYSELANKYRKLGWEVETQLVLSVMDLGEYSRCVNALKALETNLAFSKANVPAGTDTKPFDELSGLIQRCLLWDHSSISGYMNRMSDDTRKQREKILSMAEDSREPIEWSLLETFLGDTNQKPDFDYVEDSKDPCELIPNLVPDDPFVQETSDRLKRSVDTDVPAPILSIATTPYNIKDAYSKSNVTGESCPSPSSTVEGSLAPLTTSMSSLESPRDSTSATSEQGSNPEAL